MWQVLSSSLLSPWYPSEETLFCCWKKWPPNLRGNTHTHIHTHTHIYKWTHTYVLIIRHTHTHTLITTYRRLWSVRLSHVHHLEHAASGAGKRERLQSHTWAFPASTQKWHRCHRPRFIGHNEAPGSRNTAIWRVLLSIHVLQWNSWEQCCQFFLSLEKLLRYSFVQRLNVIWPSQSGIWRHFLSGSFGVSLTPYSTSACSNGINQICVSPALLPSPLSITNCRVIFVKLFLCVFTWPYGGIEEQDTILAPKKHHLETKRKFLQINRHSSNSELEELESVHRSDNSVLLKIKEVIHIFFL